MIVKYEKETKAALLKTFKELGSLKQVKDFGIYRERLLYNIDLEIKRLKLKQCGKYELE